MGNRKRFEPLQGKPAEKVCAKYLVGRSVSQICAETGFSRGIIVDCLSRHGVSLRPRIEALKIRAINRTDEERAKFSEAVRRGQQHRRLKIPLDELRELYLGGMSEKAVAEHFGVARSAIRPRLIEMGIEPRGRSQAELLKWSQMPPEKRAAQVIAAHVATRGRTPTQEEREKQARSRARNWRKNTGPAAIRLASWLEESGVLCVLEKACGRYNIDVAVAETIAVELHGGGWHTASNHRRREAERIKHLLDTGWQCLTVWIDKRRFPLTIASAEYIIAMLDELRSDHSPTRQNRVIRGDGKPWPEQRLEVD
jgi:very-short-patch-repair endonuclease